MARNNSLGEIRRSQVITVHGPGSIVDFRSSLGSGTAVSAVPAGLDQWDEGSSTPGILHPQTIHEARLEKRLGVFGFRLPPITPQEGPGKKTRLTGEELKAVRFPRWLQCPVCHVLRPADRGWGIKPGDPARTCGMCSKKEGRDVAAVPVRFVVACERGHLDDFPWHRWVKHNTGCDRTKPLKLESSGGGGLAALMVRCTACGAARSMDGVFGRDALKTLGFTCKGARPWLQKPDASCDATPRALQRGASNLYFPIQDSALDIPPWSDRIQKALAKFWPTILELEGAARKALLQGLHANNPNLRSHTFDELVEMVEMRIKLLEENESGDLRYEEYLQLTREGGAKLSDEAGSEFQVERDDAPPEIRPWIRMIGRVGRLREVRALKAFTRITPATGVKEIDDKRIAPIYVNRPNWLPAIEVRGEGIFLELDPDRVREWEQLAVVHERTGRINQDFQSDWKRRYGDEADPPEVGARMLLVHSLAHALIRELSLECGYSSASLRERLYVASEPEPMAGLLIYTATADSDGTLGGLVRQGESDRISRTVPEALRAQQWCSSDPLCIHGTITRSESLNGAACHSCLLASETSCEEFNRLLDRAVLVGAPDSPGLGYFEGLLEAAEWSD